MSMEKLIANLSGGTRRETLNGREHIVAPLTLIVPGVLDGSDGPLYYPVEEVQNNYEAWNGMPIVVYHPVVNGKPVSARSPDVLNKSGIGLVLRTVFNGKLAAEGWFDVENTRRVDARVLSALEQGQQIELSTGLFTQKEPAEKGATFNGKAYTHIARNYRPDHLAILPDQQGACSINDGCGVLVNESNSNKLLNRLAKFVGIDLDAPTDNKLSHEDVRSLLRTKLADRFGVANGMENDFWIMDVFDDHVIYEKGSELFRLDYTRKKDEVTLSGDAPVAVKRVTSFVPVGNTGSPSGSPDTLNEGEPAMAKMTADERKKIVDNLVGNCGCKGAKVWEESDRETLNAMSDEALTKLEAQGKKLAEAEATANAQPKPEPKPEPQQEPTANAATHTEEPKPMTADEWFKSAPPAVINTFRYAQKIEQDKRKEVIGKLTEHLTDNAAKLEATERLQKRDLADLEEMVALLPPPVANTRQTPRARYDGAATPAAPVANNGKPEEADILPLPTINWAEETKKQA